MRITRFVGVVAVWLCLSLLMGAQSQQEQAAAEKQITATAHQMYEAEKRKDLKFVLSKLAEDFAEVAGDGGVYHRADIEAGWSDVILKDYKLEECVFKLMMSLT